jgi:hypothetical protein
MTGGPSYKPFENTIKIKMMLSIPFLILFVCFLFNEQIKYLILRYHGCEEWQGYKLSLFPGLAPKWYKINRDKFHRFEKLKLCDIPTNCWTQIHCFQLNKDDDAVYFKNIVIDTMGEETAEKLTNCKRDIL